MVQLRLGFLLLLQFILPLGCVAPEPLAKSTRADHAYVKAHQGQLLNTAVLDTEKNGEPSEELQSLLGKASSESMERMELMASGMPTKQLIVLFNLNVKILTSAAKEEGSAWTETGQGLKHRGPDREIVDKFSRFRTVLASELYYKRFPDMIAHYVRSEEGRTKLKEIVEDEKRGGVGEDADIEGRGEELINDLMMLAMIYIDDPNKPPVSLKKTYHGNSKDFLKGHWSEIAKATARIFNNEPVPSYTDEDKKVSKGKETIPGAKEREREE